MRPAQSLARRGDRIHPRPCGRARAAASRLHRPSARPEPQVRRMAFFDSHCHLDPMRYGGELDQTCSSRPGRPGVVGMARHRHAARADSEAAAELAAREAGMSWPPPASIPTTSARSPQMSGIASSGSWRPDGRRRSARPDSTGMRTGSPRDVQRDSFDRHLRLAQELRPAGRRPYPGEHPRRARH